jgi:hypothetical protein
MRRLARSGILFLKTLSRPQKLQILTNPLSAWEIYSCPACPICPTPIAMLEVASENSEFTRAGVRLG